tara:strand:- start:8 stop:283 length:276 start_codon:yes stop_codon:yes gene_type:complete
MPKLSYPLKKYIKVVEFFVKENGLEQLKTVPNKGSVVRFEIYEVGSTKPLAMWVIHHGHTRKKEIWSPEDYKKAARCLNCDYKEFLKQFSK